MPPIVRDTTPEELEWLKFHDDQLRKISDYFVTSADKYSDIFTAINAIYVGLLTFYGLTEGGTLKNILFPLSLIFVLPIIFWIVAMFFFFQVKRPSFINYSANSPSDIREALNQSNIKKGKNYRNGIICFGLGILFMIIPLIFGLYSVTESANSSSNVQLIIGNDYVQYIQQVPIEFIPGTNKTDVVILESSLNNTYLIKLKNGDLVNIDKSWVQAIVTINQTVKQGV